MKEWPVQRRLELSDKYQTIAYTPLDIPAIGPDHWPTFLSIWNERKDRYYKQRPDARAMHKHGNRSAKGEWLGLEMWEDPNPGRRVWSCPYVPEIKETNPTMVNMIEELLPFEIIWSVKFMRSTDMVGIHQEGPMTTTMHPREFRIMLFDENPIPTFYLTPIKNRITADQSIDIQEAKRTGQKLYMSPPKENNSFVFNNETCYHGSDYNPAYSKVIISFRGYLDLDRYDELMSRSIKKFENQIIRVEPTLY
jgi:hypothetical protein